MRSPRPFQSPPYIDAAYHDPLPPAQTHYESHSADAYGPPPPMPYRPSPPPNYKGNAYGSTSSGPLDPHTASRHTSISNSVASPNAYASSWTSSPTMSQPGTRNNSIYSLDGHMSNVAFPQQSENFSRFGQPAAASNTYVDRRFSLDERARPLAGSGSLLPPRAPHAAPVSTNSRHWPWGSSGVPSSAGSSVGGAPPTSRASYDYGYASNRGHPGAVAYTGYDNATGSAGSDPLGRFRSMSSGGRYAGSGLDADPNTSAEMSMDGAPGGPHVGPGGGVTRRAKFKRSRTGCLVCRKRKVKCSQDGTPCKQCKIGKRDCYYEDNPPKRKRKSKVDDREEGFAVPTTSSRRKSWKDGNGSPSSPTAVGVGGQYMDEKVSFNGAPHSVYGSHAHQGPPPPPPAPGVAFSMPFGSAGSHDGQSNVNGSTFSSAPHDETHTPTFGSAGWPVPPGAAHHRGSFSEQQPSSYDGVDQPPPPPGSYDHRPSFDSGHALVNNHNTGPPVPPGPPAPPGPPHGLGHVMHQHPASSPTEPTWYNGGHRDSVYSNDASSVQA